MSKKRGFTISEFSKEWLCPYIPVQYGYVNSGSIDELNKEFEHKWNADTAEFELSKSLSNHE